MTRLLLTALLFVAFGFEAAIAGAWTLNRGSLQILSGVTSSRASDRFDVHGSPTGSVIFRKLLAQTWMEYGLTDAVTLYVAPEYVTAESGSDSDGATRYRSSSVEAGARILLLSRVGMLSVQASGKSAGAFDMSVSASGEAGTQFEVRMLYGRSFKLFGHNGFVDVEVAQRWISKPRPNELTVDASAGYWLTKGNLLVLQNFNIVSGSGAKPPYGDYRLHKLQASLVQRLTRRWSVQAGYFFATAGQNIVREQGFVTQIWYRT